jgi:hypothetical protein
MIFAGIDVTLQANPRAIEAGPAMFLWTWVMLWMRDQKKDGFVPRDVALACSWGGPIGGRVKANRAASNVLVTVGLWVEVEGGWLVHNYAEKNDTKATIEARIEANRKRQEEFKAKRAATPRTPSNPLPTEPGNALPKRVTAGAGAGAGVKASAPEGVQGGPPGTDTVRPNIGFLGTEREWWTRAVRRATKNPAYVAPAARDLGQLQEFIHAGTPGSSAQDSERWLTDSVFAFVAATEKHRRWYPLDRIAGFAKWTSQLRPNAAMVDELNASPGSAKPDPVMHQPPEASREQLRADREYRSKAVPIPASLANMFGPAKPDPEPSKGAA